MERRVILQVGRSDVVCGRARILTGRVCTNVSSRLPACQETWPPEGPSHGNQRIEERGGPEGRYPYGPGMHESFIASSGLSGDRPSGGTFAWESTYRGTRRTGGPFAWKSTYRGARRTGGPVSLRAGYARKFHSEFRPVGRRALRGDLRIKTNMSVNAADRRASVLAYPITPDDEASIPSVRGCGAGSYSSAAAAFFFAVARGFFGAAAFFLGSALGLAARFRPFDGPFAARASRSSTACSMVRLSGSAP